MLYDMRNPRATERHPVSPAHFTEIEPMPLALFILWLILPNAEHVLHLEFDAVESRNRWSVRVELKHCRSVNLRF